MEWEQSGWKYKVTAWYCSYKLPVTDFNPKPSHVSVDNIPSFLNQACIVKYLETHHIQQQLDKVKIAVHPQWLKYCTFPEQQSVRVIILFNLLKKTVEMHIMCNCHAHLTLWHLNLFTTIQKVDIVNLSIAHRRDINLGMMQISDNRHLNRSYEKPVLA